MPEIEARKHTVRSFDEDLADLSGKIVAMGGMVERQLANAVHALVQRDSGVAEQVIRDDHDVDRLEEQADELAVRVLATRQPMAVDLRTVAMALKISNDVERIGDYATSIAKRGDVIAKTAPTVRQCERVMRMRFLQLSVSRAWLS
jgi:phosphate transport system protein